RAAQSRLEEAADADTRPAGEEAERPPQGAALREAPPGAVLAVGHIDEVAVREVEAAAAEVPLLALGHDTFEGILVVAVLHVEVPVPLDEVQRGPGRRQAAHPLQNRRHVLHLESAVPPPDVADVAPRIEGLPPPRAGIA